MFKFLHAADIHLDSPLSGLGRSGDGPADEVRGATRRALENLVALAIAEGVKFVLIAGDVYDGDCLDLRAGLWFIARMQELAEAGIAVYLIRGNHDAENRVMRDLDFPDSIRRLSIDGPESVAIDDLGVMIHGQGFKQQKVIDDLAAGYPSATRGLLNIWMLHTCADGDEKSPHARYAPCSLDTLRSKGYGYWALGHVHTRKTLCDRSGRIEFPGNIQGRHIRETGAKGCLLVTVDDKGEVKGVDFRPLDVVRWEKCRIDGEGVADQDGLLDSFSVESGRLLDEADGRTLVVRVEVHGPSAAHADLMADQPELITQLRSRALQIGSGRLWVEKLKIATTANEPREVEELSGDAMGVLIETIDDYRRDANALMKLASEELESLRKKLPAELLCRDRVDFEDVEWLRDILDAARPIVESKLNATPSRR